MVCPILISTSVTPASYFLSARTGPLVNNKADVAMATIRVIQSVSPAVRQGIRSMVWSPLLPVWTIEGLLVGVCGQWTTAQDTPGAAGRRREKRRGFETRRGHVLRNRIEACATQFTREKDRARCG